MILTSVVSLRNVVDSDKFSYFDECYDPDECFTLTSVVTLKNIEL